MAAPANCSTLFQTHGCGDLNHNVPQDSPRELTSCSQVAHLKVVTRHRLAPDTKESAEVHIIKLMTNVAKTFPSLHVTYTSEFETKIKKVEKKFSLHFKE